MNLSEKTKDDIRMFASILSIAVSFISLYVFLKETRKEQVAKKLATAKI